MPWSQQRYAVAGLGLLVLLGLSIAGAHSLGNVEGFRELHGPVGCILLPFVLAFGGLAIGTAISFRRSRTGSKAILAAAVYAPVVAFACYVAFVCVALLGLL